MIYVGQTARIRMTFKDADGVLSTPTSGSLRVRLTKSAAGQQVVAQASWVNDSTGVYHADVTISYPGTWEWQATATVDGQSAIGQGTFVVAAPAT